VRAAGRNAAAALVLIAGCGGGTSFPPPALPALAGVTTVLRLPGGCGVVRTYLPDSLTSADWQSSGPMPAVTRLLGYDHEQRTVYVLDRQGRLVSLELETGGVRTLLAGVTAATVGPDGAVYAVDTSGTMRRILRRATSAFPARFDGPPQALFGAANGQVLVVSADSLPRVQLLSPERTGTPVPLPGTPVAATWWGEMLAAAHASQVRLIRVSDASTVRELRLPEAPRHLAFSPSGHRLYALVEGGTMAVLDRFTGNRLASVSLPGPGGELRLDGSGRWMLVSHAAADSAWVLDLSTGRLVTTVATRWRPDLPVVAGAATLLTTDGEDVEAWTLSTVPPAPVAKVAGGGRDLWMAIGWVPPERAHVALAQAESAAAQQDERLLPDSLLGPPGTQFWLQVSSSQNPEWADQLADQLFASGFPATVWRPAGPDDGYRVVVGPFGSRDEAEETARRLERPFFVVTRSGRAP
jgi:hypothetical protein